MPHAVERPLDTDEAPGPRGLKSIVVIVVNFRTAEETIAGLASLEAERRVWPHLEITALVVDNDSGDGSAETLQGAIRDNGWEAWAQVHPAGRNGGFAFGNNVGFRMVKADAYLLLNPDAQLQPGAIGALVSVMEKQEQVGIAGSVVEDERGRAHSAGRRSVTPISELIRGAQNGVVTRLLKRWDIPLPAPNEPVPCDWVSGAALMVRRAVVSATGGLDEGYFLYFEEVDFCRRAKKLGWEVWMVPESRVRHQEGTSTGLSQRRRRRPAYWYASRRRYFVKHFGRRGLVAADVLWCLGRALLAVQAAVMPSRRARLQPAWASYDIVTGDLKALLTGEVRAINKESRSDG